MMRSLCFLAALVVAALASPVSEESVELKKRIIAGLLGGEGGLLGGILGGKEGGLVGDLLGGGKEGGLLGGILGGLLGGEEGGFLGGILGTVTGLVSSLLDTVLGLITSLTSGLSGKTEKPDIYDELAKYPLNQVCPVCGGLPNAQHVSACKQFCAEKGWTGKA